MVVHRKRHTNGWMRHPTKLNRYEFSAPCVRRGLSFVRNCAVRLSVVSVFIVALSDCRL